MYFVAASRYASQSLFLLVDVIDLILVIHTVSTTEPKNLLQFPQSALRECISKDNYNLNILYII
jgi:hypothetical protein